MVLTLIFLLAVLAASLYKTKIVSHPADPFGKGNMQTLKGLAAIVVVMVHIVKEYTNPLQDAVGSFAFIAVTLFFFASAYGMEFSIDRKPDYLRSFWRNRLVALLLPALVVNFLLVAYNLAAGEAKPFSGLVHINMYIIILLEYCLAFYLLHLLGRRFGWKRGAVTWTLIALVTGSSLYNYWLVVSEGAFGDWPYERMGLVWGLLAYTYRDRLLRLLRRRYAMRLSAALSLSLILGVMYLKFKDVTFWGEYMLKLVLGIVIMAAMFLATSRVHIANPFTRLLGNISYPVYLSHQYVMFLTAMVMPALTSGEFIVIIYILTLIFSWAVYRLTDPAVKRLRA